MVSKSDLRSDEENQEFAEKLREQTKEKVCIVSAKTGAGIAELKEWMIRMVPEGFGGRTITGDLVSEGEVVLLVMPQDIQAPKGRLILPQVQTMRELLDKKCIVLSTTTDKLVEALDQLKNPPKLIITDSQVFDYVYDHKSTESLLTSFSVLFADYKGDLDYYKEGAQKLMNLSADSRVLIAECCTHAPLKEDIGREKIPRMLKKKVRRNPGSDCRKRHRLPQRPDPIRPDHPVRRLHVQPQIRPPPHPTGKKARAWQ